MIIAAEKLCHLEEPLQNEFVLPKPKRRPRRIRPIGHCTICQLEIFHMKWLDWQHEDLLLDLEHQAVKRG